MRLLILGALGPYPERVRAFLEEEHPLWYVSTDSLAPDPQIPGIPAFAFIDLAAAP